MKRKWRPNVAEYIIAVIVAWVVFVVVIEPRLNGSGIAPAAINQVQNAGVALPFQPALNFVSGGCVNNGGARSTDCTVGASSAGGVGTIFSQTNDVTDAVMTTETSLTGTGAGSVVLPANFFLTPGTVLNFQISGRYTTTAAPVSLRMRLKTTGGATGTVNLCDTGVDTGILASVTTGPWVLWGSITSRTAGAGGTMILNGGMLMGSSSLASLTPADLSCANGAVLTVDTTSTQTIDLTAVWGAAGQSITSTNYVLVQPGGPPAPQFGTFAAQPACSGSLTNLVYYFTNSAYNNAVCNGTAWTFFGLGQQLTPPPTAGWTADNGATLSTTNGYAFLTAAATGAVQLRTQFRNAPAAPYTVTAALNVDFSGITGTIGDLGYAIGFRDGTGKYVALLVAYAGGTAPGPLIADDKWTNSTTLASTYLQSTVGGPNNCGGVVGASWCPNAAFTILTRPIWLRVSDDNVNLNFFYSIDGQDFTRWDVARSRTDFLAAGPTQIFFGAYALGGPVNVQLISWTAQ